MASFKSATIIPMPTKVSFSVNVSVTNIPPDLYWFRGKYDFYFVGELVFVGVMNNPNFA